MSLIRVSQRGVNREFANFFLAVSQEEPIFHVETLAYPLDDTRPDKKYIIFLVNLAKANVIALERREPSSQAFYDARQKLLRLLASYSCVRHFSSIFYCIKNMTVSLILIFSMPLRMHVSHMRMPCRVGRISHTKSHQLMPQRHSIS